MAVYCAVGDHAVVGVELVQQLVAGKYLPGGTCKDGEQSQLEGEASDARYCAS